MAKHSSRLHRVLAVVFLGLGLAGCRTDGPTVQQRALRDQVVALLEAGAAGDTVRLRSLAVGTHVISDLQRLRGTHPRLYDQPGKRFSTPYSVATAGDTTVAFFRVRGFGRREFATEFRKAGSGWRVVRLGFSAD
jgi:hypothetical protein